MKTAIVTDSASYLTAEQAEENQITIVPITVIFGQEQFKENVDITAKQFYERMATEDELPSTAQITMSQMQEVFDRLTAEGYDEVICIHLSTGITSFLDNLKAYAPSVKEIKVYPFDSLITSAGEGYMALLAAKMVAEGKHAADILPALETFRDTTGVYFVVDNLSHLLRTGRISNSSAFVGNLLRIKPILTFNETGQIVAIGKERTMKRAFNKVKSDFAEALKQVNYPVRLNIVDGNNPEMSAEWVAAFQTEFPDLPIDTSHIGPVVGVHTGEKVMGIIWARDWKKM